MEIKEYKIFFPDGTTQTQTISENCLDIETASGVEQPRFTRVAKNHYNLAVTNNVMMLQKFHCLPAYTYSNTFKFTTPFTRANEFDYGTLTQGMGTTGERWELGPFPEHVYEYCNGSATALSYIIGYGDVAGTLYHHFYDKDGKYITIDSNPNMWVGPQSVTTWTIKGDKSSVKFKSLLDHMPNLVTAPLLITGYDYHFDNLRHLANHALFFDAPGYRGYAKGNLAVGIQVRATAWGVRALAQAVAYLPDSDPLKAHFREKLITTLDDLDTLAKNNTGLFDWIGRVVDGGTEYPGFYTIGLFELAYLAWAMYHANLLLGIENGKEYLRKLCKFQMDMYKDPKWKSYMCSYRIPVRKTDTAKTWLQSWDEVWNIMAAKNAVQLNPTTKPASLVQRTDFSIMICDIAHHAGFDGYGKEAADWLRTQRAIIPTRGRYDFTYDVAGKDAKIVECMPGCDGVNTVFPVVYQSDKQPDLEINGASFRYEHIGKIRDNVYFGRMFGKFPSAGRWEVRDKQAPVVIDSGSDPARFAAIDTKIGELGQEIINAIKALKEYTDTKIATNNTRTDVLIADMRDYLIGKVDQFITERSAGIYTKIDDVEAQVAQLKMLLNNLSSNLAITQKTLSDRDAEQDEELNVVSVRLAAIENWIKSFGMKV